MIAVVDYGMGNVGSVLNMLNKVGCNDAELVSSPVKLRRAKKVILPGVGAFNKGMKSLKSSGMKDELDSLVLEHNVPLLGICLGMQLLTNSSEEGDEVGLGWIDAKTLRFDLPPDSNLKIPHMGWNYIDVKRENRLLNYKERERFYFVHSYYVSCTDVNDILATTNYGSEITVAVQKNNIWGMQFHPEKSHRFGMSVFSNFVALK